MMKREGTLYNDAVVVLMAENTSGILMTTGDLNSYVTFDFIFITLNQLLSASMIQSVDLTFSPGVCGRRFFSEAQIFIYL